MPLLSKLLEGFGIRFSGIWFRVFGEFSIFPVTRSPPLGLTLFRPAGSQPGAGMGTWGPASTLPTASGIRVLGFGCMVQIFPGFLHLPRHSISFVRFNSVSPGRFAAGSVDGHVGACLYSPATPQPVQMFGVQGAGLRV